jgi:hypothetical protein
LVVRYCTHNLEAVEVAKFGGFDFVGEPLEVLADNIIGRGEEGEDVGGEVVSLEQPGQRWRPIIINQDN